MTWCIQILLPGQKNCGSVTYQQAQPFPETPGPLVHSFFLAESVLVGLSLSSAWWSRNTRLLILCIAGKERFVLIFATLWWLTPALLKFEIVLLSLTSGYSGDSGALHTSPSLLLTPTLKRLWFSLLGCCRDFAGLAQLHQNNMKQEKTKTKKQPPEQKVHWQSTCSAWVSFFLFFAASLVASFNASFASNIARSAWQTLKYVQLAVCPAFMQRNYTDTCMPLQRKKSLKPHPSPSPSPLLSLSHLDTILSRRQARKQRTKHHHVEIITLPISCQSCLCQFQQEALLRTPSRGHSSYPHLRMRPSE